MMHASLFSGLGGFDLAAEWMGWENKFSCEIDPFCQRVLRHHFPSTNHYGDIRSIDGREWRGKIDVLTGGFPCQPFSNAGERRGEDDDRFLWPEMLRVIREVQPTWIVAENVRGIVSIDEGLVFERVCSELEANGYEVQPFCIPACAVQAPHRRERLWFVAADTKRKRLQGFGKNTGLPGTKKTPYSECFNGMFRTWDTVARSVRGVRSIDGLSPAMVQREIKAYGNAIVPQVAYQIFQAISQAHNG